MDRAEVSRKFRDIAGNKLEIDMSGVKESVSLLSIGSDSLNLVELILELEEEFEIKVLDEDVERLATVGELIDYIQKKVK